MRKETQHILRDRTTFFLVMLTPLILLFVMAYALTVDIEQVPVAVLDDDASSTSRAFIQQVTEGPALALYRRVDTIAQLERLLVEGQVKAALIIRPTFEEDLFSLKGMPLQIVIDGTEPESGNFAVEQISGRAEAFFNAWVARQGLAEGLSADALQPIDLSVRALYNPSLKPRVDMVPGLISLVLGFPALSVALSLAHEREHGTLEQVLVTPVGRAELLLGKMMPYLLVGALNVIVIPTVARITFRIPFHGSFLLFFLLSIVFLFAILGMGMVIGVFMRTQPAALALSFLAIFFPGFFMTGIFFPLSSMPAEVRMEAMMLPGTHYAVITRGIFLRAAGLEVFGLEVLALLGLGIAFVAVAAFFFRKKLG
jgi:ABC-type multidrug transport system permease subunit